MASHLRGWRAGGIPAPRHSYGVSLAIAGGISDAVDVPVDQLLDTAKALAIVESWLKTACNAQGKCGVENLELLRPNAINFVPGYDSRIDKTLKSPYVQEFTVGYGAQFLQNLASRSFAVAHAAHARASWAAAALSPPWPSRFTRSRSI